MDCAGAQHSPGAAGIAGGLSDDRDLDRSAGEAARLPGSCRRRGSAPLTPTLPGAFLQDLTHTSAAVRRTSHQLRAPLQHNRPRGILAVQTSQHPTRSCSRSSPARVLDSSDAPVWQTRCERGPSTQYSGATRRVGCGIDGCELPREFSKAGVRPGKPVSKNFGFTAAQCPEMPRRDFRTPCALTLRRIK